MSDTEFDNLESCNSPSSFSTGVMGSRRRRKKIETFHMCVFFYTSIVILLN